MAVMLAVTAVLLDLPIGWAGACASIAFSAVSHGFWDRRWPVKMWMTMTGSREFAKNPQGRYSVDLLCTSPGWVGLRVEGAEKCGRSE